MFVDENAKKIGERVVDNAVLMSSEFGGSSGIQCFTFWYHLAGMSQFYI